MSENKKNSEGLISFIKKHVTKKTVWFICVFIFVSVLLGSHWEKCMAFNPVSGYTVFFFVFILLLLYPFFDSVKISTAGIDITKSGPLKQGIESKANTAVGKVEILDSLFKCFNKSIPLKLNQQIELSAYGRKKRELEETFALGIVERNEPSEDMPESGGIEKQPDSVSFFENANALKSGLNSKYKRIVGRNCGHDEMYQTLDGIYTDGIGKMDDSLSESTFTEWADKSKRIIEPVDKKAKTNLYENYGSLIDCLTNTDLPPCQKLNACIDYTLDVMKLIAEAK